MIEHLKKRFDELLSQADEVHRRNNKDIGSLPVLTSK